MTSQKTIYLIDTNVILRYLLDDHPEFSPKAARFMMKVANAEIKAEILDVVLIECIYVMEKHYKIPRKVIVNRLARIIGFDGIVTINKVILINALLTYQKHAIDIVDCLLHAYSSKTKPVVSFDRDFEKLNTEGFNLH